MRENIETMRAIIGNDSQIIAYHKGCSRQRVEREYNSDFPNLLDRIEKDVRAWAKTNWSKVQLFENWLEILIRQLRRELFGQIESLPIETEKGLILIRSQIDELLAV